MEVTIGVQLDDLQTSSDRGIIHLENIENIDKLSPATNHSSPDIRLVLICPERPTVLYAFALDYINHLEHRFFRRDDAVYFPW